jgi:high-affinity K+ transport system ATPase subunit B
VEEPGDVRHRGRRGLTTLDLFFTKDSRSFRRADFALALVHGDLRQLRRSDGRRPRQGPGRHAAQEPHQKRRPQADARWLDPDRPAESLRKGDIFIVEANELIAADGEIIEGAASVNESAITGESAPVIREAGGDRSAVTGGTTVLSDQIKVRVTANPGESFMDRMIELIEGAKRQKTPNEIALSILLAGLTIIFLVVCITLMPFAIFTQHLSRRRPRYARSTWRSPSPCWSRCWSA